MYPRALLATQPDHSKTNTTRRNRTMSLLICTIVAALAATVEEAVERRVRRARCPIRRFRRYTFN